MNSTVTAGDARQFMVRPGTFDDYIVESVYRLNEYRLPPQLPNRTVVIDIGAHIGAFSLAAVDRGAQNVLAVEPTNENRMLAAHNMRVELTTGQVQLSFAAAAGPHRVAVRMGPAPMHSGKVNSGGHRVADREADPSAQGIVGVVALDALIRKAEVELAGEHLWLKLDCESSEWEILGTCTRLDAFDVIVGEYHELPGETFGPQRPCTEEGLVDHLQSAGFTMTLERDTTTPCMGLFWASRHT